MRAILALALGLRLAVVGNVLISYPRDWLFSKAPDLGFLACSLSSGHGLSSPFGGSTGPTAFLAPGYPGVQQINLVVPAGLGGVTTQLYACGTSAGTEVCSLPVPLTLK